MEAPPRYPPVVLSIHPQVLLDDQGRPVSVQMPIAEFRTLVVAAYGAGLLSEGEASSLLGVSRAEFFELARAAGVSTCSYSEATIDAELSQL
jgi:predicted HTH domain antitoxin